MGIKKQHHAIDMWLRVGIGLVSRLMSSKLQH